MTKTHLIITLIALILSTSMVSAEQPLPRSHPAPSLLNVIPTEAGTSIAPVNLRYTGAGLTQTLFLKSPPVIRAAGTTLAFQPGISRAGQALEPALNIALKNAGSGLRLQHIAQLSRQESRLSAPLGKKLELRFHHVWGQKSLLLTGVKVAPGTKLFYATNLATGQSQFRVMGQLRF